MSKNKKKYYITTAILYTSSKPHIGNIYEIILADTIARFKRFEGYDVRFQTGVDEHGLKIENKAKENNMSPQEYVDMISNDIKSTFDLVNISYDKFIRTSDKYHKEQVQRIFKYFYNKGDIYKGEYKGKYCIACESFFKDSQLIDNKCPDCGKEVKEISEEAYFFKMSKYVDKLIKYIKENDFFIQPESRKNEILNNFLLPGLQDLCVSRSSFNWGINVDFDKEHVVYVWLDALMNYITGLGFYMDKDCNIVKNENFDKYWPADLHVIGKDIIRFHIIYWPIFLLSLGLEIPKQIFGHPWLLQKNTKMSKSKGNVIYTEDLVNLVGVDAVRYFVLREMSFDNDGVIDKDLLIDKVNSDLANILGNIVNRVIVMINKYFDGVVSNKNKFNTKEEDNIDNELINFISDTIKKIFEKMNKLRISDSLALIFDILKKLNKYIDITSPWLLSKDKSKVNRLNTVLYNVIEGIEISANLLSSFMPETAYKILKQINGTIRDIDTINKFGIYKSGTIISKNNNVLFKKIEI